VSRSSRVAFAALLVAYLVLAVGYSLADPLYESTDELRHFRYVRYLVVYHSLPSQRADTPRAQSHHPPLYYALGALISGGVPVAQEIYYNPPENPFWGYRYWEVSDDNKNQYLHGDDERFPFRGIALAVYVVRWMTILIGAGVVWLTYRIGHEMFPDRPALALGGAALVAFNPQFLYLSGAVNNDILAALCSAAALWACVRLVQRGPTLRADVTLGALYGLALLTKFNLLALLVLIELAYVLAVWKAHDWRALLRGTVVVLGLAALISGWWFWRNQMLYSDPTGMAMVNELWEGGPAAGNWWMIWQSLPYLWSSLWGRFGYGQVPLPQPIYQALLGLCVLALAGYLFPPRVSDTKRDRRPGFSRETSAEAGRLPCSILQAGRGPLPRTAMVLLAVDLIVFTAVVLYYIMIQPAGAMGRFLFPSLPAFALLSLVGLSRLFARQPTWTVNLTVTAGMVALAVYVLAGVLVPAFARPRPLAKSELAGVPHPTSAEFGDVARLLGYQVTPAVVQPGGVVEVTLYWQALTRTDQNYAVFVHLLSEVGTMIAQRDTYPGLGRYPTTIWEPGTAFADTYRVHIPETAYAPDVGYIQVGLYLPNGPRLTLPDGRDTLRLATVEIQPRPGKFPNPLNANFGNRIALVGYTLDRRVVRPGERISLTLYWQALAPIETDYNAFAHVLGMENQVWANSDIQPVNGAIPTSQWQPGQVVEDVRALTVGLTTPPDFYDIEIGLYVPGKDRLPVVAEDDHWLGDRVLLSKIRVISDE